MKLVRLTLRNWGPFAHAEFTPTAPIVLVYGLNAAGKTTLADALQWLVSARARGVPDRGPAQLALIRTGAAEGVVEAEWHTSQGEQVTLRRKLGRAGSGMVGSLPGDKVAREAAALFFHGEDVLDLEPEAQKAMLLAATEPKISVAALRKAVPLDRVPSEVLPWRPTATDPDGDSTFLNRADVTAIYKWSYEARTDANRRLGDLGSVAPVEWPGGTPLGPAGVAALEADFAALRTQEQALAVEVGETIGRRKALADRLRATMHRAEQTQQAITTLMGSYPSAQAIRTELLSLEERIQRAQAAQAAWQKDVEEVRRVNQAVRDRRLDRAAAVKQFAALGATCVIHASIPCPLQGEAKGAAALRLGRQLDEAEDERIEPEPKPPEVSASALRTTTDQLSLTIRSLEAKAELRAAAEAEVQELLAQGAKPSEALNEPEVPPALTALRQRIAVGQETIKLATDLQRRESVRADAIAKGETLRASVAWLTDVVKALGPKGAIEAQMAGSLDELMELANTWLQPWGLALSWKTEPFALMTPDGRLASRLSDSERWRVSAALSLACAVRAGWKTVVLDGADVLLPEIRGPLGPMLGAAAVAGLLVIVTVSGAPPADGNRKPAAGMERWLVGESETGATLARL